MVEGRYWSCRVGGLWGFKEGWLGVLTDLKEESLGWTEQRPKAHWPECSLCQPSPPNSRKHWLWGLHACSPGLACSLSIRLTSPLQLFHFFLGSHLPLPPLPGPHLLSVAPYLRCPFTSLQTPQLPPPRLRVSSAHSTQCRPPRPLGDQPVLNPCMQPSRRCTLRPSSSP